MIAKVNIAVQKEDQSHNPLKDLVNYHFVWIPQRRKKVLGDATATRLKQIIFELSVEKGWDILALEVASERVHLFIIVTPTDEPHIVIKAVKGRSSYFLRQEFPELKKLPSLWTNSYFICTAGKLP